jgi:hypothetical protein
VVCENRALWLAAKFPTSQFRCSEATERCGWPENLLNFVKFRNAALWLVGENPTSSISQKKKLSALVGSIKTIPPFIASLSWSSVVGW